MNCLVLLLALSLLYGCGAVSKTNSPFSPSTSIVVTPTTAQIRAGDTHPFAAIVGSPRSVSPGSSDNPRKRSAAGVVYPANPIVIWSVDGISGGNATVGTIDAKGLYTAPATLPNPNSVIVTATSVAEPSVSSDATVTLENPVPMVTSVLPTTVSVGSFTLIVSGGGFVKGSQVLVAGAALQTTFNSAEQLTATGAATQAQVGNVQVTVKNPDPGSTSSTANQLKVTPPATPPATTGQNSSIQEPSDEFVGPFPSWANAKLDYGAAGDGVNDDTQALQNGLNDIGTSGKPSVLFLPTGTYRITKTLDLKYKRGVSFIGEDPATTIIRWTGPAGGTMMLSNGVAYSRWGRITWDGKGSAGIGIAHQWDKVGGYAATSLEHADEIFENMSKCLEGGLANGWNDSEVSILRDQFIHCTTAGISVESFNALNWFVWYSKFISNGIGITNEFGAGNFLVENNLFQGSRTADVTIHNTYYFSLRNNTSVGSRTFFIGRPIGNNSAQITIQGNTIIDPTGSTPIQIANLGPILMIDNVISSSPNGVGPVVNLSGSAPGDLVSIGNTYTVVNPVSVQGRLTSVDDAIVGRDTFNFSPPVLPSVLPNYHRTIFEVPVGASATTIQQLIQLAVLQNGSHPVVHLPSAIYPVNQTIIIPPNTDLQFIGDGEGASTLDWAGPGSGPVIMVQGPSSAILREFRIEGHGVAEGILVQSKDQPGARVYIDGSHLDLSISANFFVDSLDHTYVELRDVDSMTSKGAGIRIVGGKSAAQGNPFEGTTNIFTACTAGNALNYDVSNGAKVLVRDAYYETSDSGSPTFLRLAGRGTFTLHGAKVAVPVSAVTPVFDLSRFAGNATFLATQIDDVHGSKGGVIQTGGQQTLANVLGLGLASQQSGTFVNNLTSSSAKTHILNSQYYGTLRSGSVGWMQASDVGAPDVTFLRSMLAHTRSEQPQIVTSLPPGVTDVRIYRVWAENCTIGYHIK